MKFQIMLGTVLLAVTGTAAEVPPADVQIAAAILAAPADLREGAAVLGYNPQGELVRLRDGKNELICLANNPGNKSFSVACYHRDLEPYMTRGRELLAQGITGQKRNEVRWKEVADGKLSLPREARTLYILTGAGFDTNTGKVTDAYLRWVIYLPFATPETTGLSTKASENAPWLMFPGTAGAHIMINPPKK
ncbi:MAG TPA: hypothetical protein VH325_04080 [Bryobacteraceae bacterium]|jgi:hypothetical protein|nr:hypothetical protein [Bryobacteraceae bacterium]